jgi:uncharacterized protein (DUF2336 family)
MSGMAASPIFPGFDGLMTLSRREGVDIRPTLLRVLTDLYVQASAHSEEEARQFIELTSRLFDQVDDATRAAVRARLAIYPGTPIEILRKLGLKPAEPDPPPAASEVPAPRSSLPATGQHDEPPRRTANLAMQPQDAADISEMFFGAGPSERAQILHNLVETPLKASPRIPAARAVRALQTLEMAAYAADLESFTLEFGEALILPSRLAARVVNDPGGEPLACGCKALDIPSAAFQRILLFLKPEVGSSVDIVYRLSRLYDHLNERAALIMLAAWRGSVMAVARAKYRPSLYDDERHRARAATGQARPAQQSGSGVIVLNNWKNSGR